MNFFDIFSTILFIIYYQLQLEKNSSKYYMYCNLSTESFTHKYQSLPKTDYRKLPLLPKELLRF